MAAGQPSARNLGIVLDHGQPLARFVEAAHLQVAVLHPPQRVVAAIIAAKAQALDPGLGRLPRVDVRRNALLPHA